METVFLGLGSNRDPARHLRIGFDALEARFGEIRRSPVYQSVAVGFQGADFLNACAEIRCELGPVELKAWLTALEDAHGRRRDLPKYSDRNLDIDILLHGNRVGNFDGMELPRGEILEYAHVLRPLTDLAPDLVHPLTGTTFAEHWRAFSGDRTLEPVTI